MGGPEAYPLTPLTCGLVAEERARRLAGADLSFQVCAPQLNRQMEAIGHQHPPDQPKPELLPHPAQDLSKYLAEALAGKDRHASVGAGSDKLQMTRMEDPVIAGHGVKAWLKGLHLGAALLRPVLNRVGSRASFQVKPTPSWSVEARSTENSTWEVAQCHAIADSPDSCLH